MSYDKLKGQKNQIRQQLPENQSTWILDKYLPHIKRGSVKSRGSQANYLQAIKKILYMTDKEINPEELGELSEEQLNDFNIKIVENIQDSKYRATKGDNNKRRKTHQWTAWKRALETDGVETGKHKSYIPHVKFQDTDNVERQGDTEPEDLPTPDQMKKFVKKLGEVSGNGTALRNQALALLLWDKGPRIGEALSLQIKHVKQTTKNYVELEVPGNKKSKDRSNKVLQGSKTLKDWIQKHPAKDDPEAYLFPNMNDGGEMGTKSSLRQKFKQARREADLEFDLEGQPMHLFRKAMITSSVVNEWSTWDKILTTHGKTGNETKPDYLKMATSDIDATVAENMGLSIDEDGEKDNRMIGEPLLPVQCESCDRLNRCYLDVCDYCGEELPESSMPESIEKDSEEQELAELRAQLKQMHRLADKMGVDLE